MAKNKGLEQSDKDNILEDKEDQYISKCGVYKQVMVDWRSNRARLNTNSNFATILCRVSRFGFVRGSALGLIVKRLLQAELLVAPSDTSSPNSVMAAFKNCKLK